MEGVRRTRREVVIMKRGVPTVRLVPAEPPRSPADVFGCLADEMEIVADLAIPLHTDEYWAELARQRHERWRALEGKAVEGASRPKPRRSQRHG
jgi:hypothetical protein